MIIGFGVYHTITIIGNVKIVLVVISAFVATSLSTRTGLALRLLSHGVGRLYKPSLVSKSRVPKPEPDISPKCPTNSIVCTFGGNKYRLIK